MTWIASFALAITAAGAGMLGAGLVAALIANWYRVTSFEGAAGFFVVGIAFFGLIGGFVIGLVVARIEARRPQARFRRALRTTGGVIGAILVAIAGVSWLLADIPPRLDGDELFLLTEIRWPDSGAAAPNTIEGVPYLRLGALSGSTVRRMETGVLFIADARQENGRWVVPGAVPVFTSRGGRFLEFGADNKSIAGFVVPLPRHPGNDERQWSAWLPAGADRLYTHRFRVIRRSEPIRAERFGAFNIDTIADNFYAVPESERLAMRATFRVQYSGRPVPGVGRARTVAVVGGSTPALFVTIEEPESDKPCALIVDEGRQVRVQAFAGCSARVNVLTSDHARFTAARAHVPLPGWVDRLSLAEPGLFQVGEALLDTRAHTISEFQFPLDSDPDSEVPPLDLSPDQRSFVWLAQGSADTPQLGVTNWRANGSYFLPIDPVRMRYNSESALNPEWVRHHFEWRRGKDGAEVLVQRPAFTPLPYRGDLSLQKPGETQSYTLRPGGEELRAAVVDLLLHDLGGERVPDDPGGYREQVRVNGKVLSISLIGSPTYVYVSMQGDASDPQAMLAIASKLDAALATGRYDALFVAK